MRRMQMLVEDGTMFEHSLIDLETKPRSGRRWISLPIALGLHLVGLTAFAFASYWSVGEVPEPDLIDVFRTPPPIPISAYGGGPKPPVKPPVSDDQGKPRPPEPLVQPTPEDVPSKPPAPLITAVENINSGSTTTSGDSTSEGTGDSKGQSEGTDSGDGRGGEKGVPDLDVVDRGPIHISVGMSRPVIIHQVQPRYTERARQAGIQGAVIVEAIIDEKGYVTDVRVLRGLPMGLDQAAVDAIQQWRFKPATLAGQAVRIYYTLTVNFKLQR